MGSLTVPVVGKRPAQYLAGEAGTVVELLSVIQQVRGISGATGRACPVLDADQRRKIFELVEPWRSRPVNFAFLVKALVEHGIWQEIEGETGKGKQTLGEINEAVAQQAKETGALANVGDLDTESLRDLLDPKAEASGAFDEYMTTGFGDGDAMKLFERLQTVSPDARGALVRQIDRMGRLRDFCEHLPWKYVEALHDSIGGADLQACALLDPYYEDKGGGRSMHQIYMDKVDDRLAHGHPVRAFGWYFLDTLHNFFTAGFEHEYSDAYDAHEQGWTTDDQFHDAAAKAVGKAAVIMAASAVTGGAAGEFAGGAAESLGAGRSAAQLIAGGAGGFAAGVGGHFAGDVYDQMLNGKEGFDSFGSYMRSGAEGAVFGTVLSGVSLAGGKYLPRSAQRTVDIYAERFPSMTRVLEDIRAAGVESGSLGRSAAITVKMKVSEFLDLRGSGLGGPPFGTSPQPAFATAGARVRSLPPDADIWVRLRPTRPLTQPMQMSASEEKVPGDASSKMGGSPPGHQEPLLEIESVEPVDPAKLTNEQALTRPSPVRPEDVDAVVASLKSSGQVTGDMGVLDRVAKEARAGHDGKLGELEALQRWGAAGKTVEVLPEAQNQRLASGETKKNPDYRVDGVVTEVKNRTAAFPEPGQGGKRSRDWVKESVSDASKQIKNSGLNEQGDVELQLRGDADLTITEIDRQVRGNFNQSTNRSLRRVAVYKQGELIGEWVRGANGVVERTFPMSISGEL